MIRAGLLFASSDLRGPFREQTPSLWRQLAVRISLNKDTGKLTRRYAATYAKLD